MLVEKINKEYQFTSPTVDGAFVVKLALDKDKEERLHHFRRPFRVLPAAEAQAGDHPGGHRRRALEELHAHEEAEAEDHVHRAPRKRLYPERFLISASGRGGRQPGHRRFQTTPEETHMLYLNEKDLQKMGLNWNETIDGIEKAVHCLETKDFSQPIKPYLRYRDPGQPHHRADRVRRRRYRPGGHQVDRQLPEEHRPGPAARPQRGDPEPCRHRRAGGHHQYGQLSIVRTASVSGLMIRYFDKARPLKNANVAIMGWGPIGRHHYKMVCEVLKDKIGKITLYDVRDIDPATIDGPYKDKTVVAKSWQEAYEDADVFITCTVSPAPYVDLKPKAGSLQLNCSLRDYKTSILDHTKAIIVDDWEEVCREKTDIEMMHTERGLKEEDTKSIVDVVCNNAMAGYESRRGHHVQPHGHGGL